MRFTGERVIPDRFELLPMLQEHLARYRFAQNYVDGLHVLDLGCGCGYGTHLLAIGGANDVVGVDVDGESIAYAREHYAAPNLRFEMGDGCALDFADGQFNAIVCLEVFEHVADHEALLREVARVLAPDGVLVLSTPNQRVWSAGRSQPINPWHIREFRRGELADALSVWFRELEFSAQTTRVPGIVPFVLANLRLQGYYVRHDTLGARVLEAVHLALMKAAMLPPRFIPGAMEKDPNIILPEHQLAPDEQHYFLAVAKSPLGSQREVTSRSSVATDGGGQHA